jgi:hypothetical protein
MNNKTINLIEAAILNSATEFKCSKCGGIEYVMPLDEEPIDDLIDGYTCSDCDI